jgi:hypothetical protein
MGRALITCDYVHARRFVHIESARGVGDRAKPPINCQPCRCLTITLVNHGERAGDAVDVRIHTRRLGNEGAIDAKPCSAALLAGVLFEHIDGHPSACEADSGCESREGPPYDCNITSERFGHMPRLT